jgi:hypothetical protein
VQTGKKKLRRTMVQLSRFCFKNKETGTKKTKQTTKNQKKKNVTYGFKKTILK